MKKIILIMVVLNICACTSIDMYNVLNVEETDNPKLPTLEAVYVDSTLDTPQYWDVGSKVVQRGTIRAQLFYNKLEKELTNPFENSLGYIELQDNTVVYMEPLLLWTPLSVLSLGAINLLGIPANSYKLNSNINVRILDKKGNLVKRYNAYSENKEYIAMWWGYAAGEQENFKIKIYRETLDKVFEDIKNDYKFLSEKLK